MVKNTVSETVHNVQCAQPLQSVEIGHDGCEAYVPDTITFGMQIETLWNDQKEARA